MSRSDRRSFLKTVAAASASTAAGAQPQPAPAAASGPIGYPRVYTGRQLAMIAFPLGGVGAGSISLGGRGQLRDWEIFNRPDKGRSPQYAFPAIWISRPGAKPLARVLEAEILPPYEGASGLGFANVPGLPRLRSARFTGEFPLAAIEFVDRRLPVAVALEAFTPFIPHHADESGLPIAVLRYRVRNTASRPAKVSVAFSIDNPVGGKGRVNEPREAGGIRGLVMTNPGLAGGDPQAGSFALCVLGEGDLSLLRGWRSGTMWRVGPLLFWDDFSSDGRLGPEPETHDAVGSVCLQREIAPAESADFTFLLAWHFPNRTPQGCGWRAPKGDENTVIGNWYSTRFSDAWAAAVYAAANLPGLERRTRQFAAIMRASTLPAAVKDAAMSNLSTLVSPTCFRTADGAFHGFEGSSDHAGCCHGNCTHVWNYETATAFLFPALARSLRDNALGFCTSPEGAMDFRQLLPAGKQRTGAVAADGQMGQLMHLYLDWKLSGDGDWLRRYWPTAKRALEFAWIEGGWDADRDGVMEGVQHNTYDVEFLGPNPLCGIWYLGALRACEEMARAAGDGAAANEYRRLFESGSRWIDRNLFNGEYYRQIIKGTPRDRIAKGLTSGMGARDTESPDFQLGDGCLVDQLCGQYFARAAGLGTLLNEVNVRQALASIYKYNYKRSLEDHESVQRVYALNDEAALLICDYARGNRPRIPFPYFAEVMTGFEYSAAVLMLYEGMIDQGLECIANIRRRYDGERRNPWDEAECGHHYARAMAAWSAVPALGGFEYDGASRRLSAAPRIRRENFVSFWSTATGWGSFSHTIAAGRLRFILSLAEGRLPLREVAFFRTVRAPSAHAGEREIRVEARGNTLLFRQDPALNPGDRLTILA